MNLKINGLSFLLFICMNCAAQLPYLVKDTNPGTANGLTYGYSPYFYNGVHLFVPNQSATGNELWRTDGTTAGTYLIKDIYTGSTSSNPSSFFEFNGEIYFSATTALNGKELWKTNGTAAGTMLVKDIMSGSGNGINTFTVCWQHNGFFYFTAYSSFSTDNELWKSDGTTAGTTKVYDIYSGTAGSYPSNFVEFNNQLFFSADNGTNGKELWKTDGTTAGTALVRDILVGTGDGLSNFFSCWQKNGYLYFVATSLASSDFEIWKSDGTALGTSKLKDICIGPNGSYPHTFFEFNGQLFFSADNGSIGDELWKTDGTAAGTSLVKDILSGTGTGLNNLYVIWEHNGFFYFVATGSSASDYEIWKSDGTTAGTTKLKDIYPGTTGSSPGNIYEFNNTLYFTANNGTNGDELWKTDGTTAGTTLVKDIYAGTGDGLNSLYVFWVHNGFFFFIATSSSSSDYEIWKSDGTAAGTTKLKDINLGTSGSSPGNFYEFNNQLYFGADNGINGKELWKTDGTTAGTLMIKDIFTGVSSNDSDPYFFASYNGFVYFRAATLIYTNYEIWKSDGTAAGTSMVLDIYPGTSSANPNSFSILNNTYLMFSATNASAGSELWAFNMVGIANDIALKTDELDFAVYPNPAKDIITVRASEPGLTIQLFDLNGKLINETVSQENSSQIDVSACSSGMYFVRCRNKTSVINRKIIVE
ncbi:MAG: T9SS type A sorting domain-containing protein [Bacteroidetes bacterium]|nr:T9SS type A sorting domain-containing protein [Bacteroidota bacterium]